MACHALILSIYSYILMFVIAAINYHFFDGLYQPNFPHFKLIRQKVCFSCYRETTKSKTPWET